jgi:hypothetical protein
MNTNDQHQETGTRALRAVELDGVSAFDLARGWGERAGWRIGDDRRAEDELAELAVMSALAAWLDRWAPISVHRAVLGGATPTQVADAMGTDVSTVAQRWRAWADRQRWLRESGSRFGMPPAEYATVAAALDERGPR